MKNFQNTNLVLTLFVAALFVSACKSAGDRCHFSSIDHINGIFFVSGDGGTEYNAGNDCSLDIRFINESERSEVKAAYAKSKFESYIRPIKLSVAGSYKREKRNNSEFYNIFEVKRISSIDAIVNEEDARQAFKKAHGMESIP